MPVPRQRLSQRRGRTRASHHALKTISTVTCPNCKKPALPHQACASCGYYKGRNLNDRSVITNARQAKAAKIKAAIAASTAPIKAPATKPADAKSTK